MSRFSESWRAGGTGRGAYILTPQTTSQVPLVVQGISGQTLNIFEVQNSAGAVLFSVDPNGNLSIAGTANITLNEAVTGNLSLTGNLSVSGTSTLTGAVTIGTTLSVTGASSFTGLATFDGAIINNLTVGGVATLAIVRFGDGSVTIPSIAFSADTDTGFYRIGANSLGLTVGGSNLFTFGSTTTTTTKTINIFPTSDSSAIIIKEFVTPQTARIFDIQDSSGSSKISFNSTSVSGDLEGASMVFSTSGSDIVRRVGLELSLRAGFTGNEFTTALSFDNTVAGVNTAYTLDLSTYGYRPGGNRGIGGFSRATTVGHNTGLMAGAGGGAYNYGAWCFATVNKSSAVNVGVFGVAQNQSGGAGASRIGGYFAILNQATAPAITSINCALVADNGVSGADVFICRNSSVDVLKISDLSIMTYTTLANASNLAATTESTKVNWIMTGVQTWATGTVATQREIRFQAPTYAAAGASTFSNAMTFQIDSCPNASTNVTFEKVHAAQFGGNASIGPTNANQIYAAISVPAHTITVTGTTGVTSVGPSSLRLNIVTMTDSSAVTIDTASTLYIAGAVAQAGSVTITNKYSMWIDAGLPRIDSTTANGVQIMALGATGPAAANAAPQEWLTVDINGVTRYIPCF